MRSEPLEPHRVRYPKGPYGWVDLRIVTEGHLQALDQGTALTYLFLCTVGNREGVSFWSRSRMARTLNLTLEAIEAALQTLSAFDLIAVTERVVQVLPIPARHAREQAGAEPETNPPSVTRSRPPAQPLLDIQPDVSEDDIRAHEEQARAQIARFYGTQEPSTNVVRALAQSLARRSLSRAAGGRSVAGSPPSNQEA